jgi:hypothetical protein
LFQVCLFNPAAAGNEDRKPSLAALRHRFKETLFSARSEAIFAIFGGLGIRLRSGLRLRLGCPIWNFGL